MKPTDKVLKVRNPYHDHPSMKKGGKHEPKNTRSREEQKLQRELKREFDK